MPHRSTNSRASQASREAITEDRRLMILKALAATGRYGANRTLIQRFLETDGHVVSIDLVDTDVAWLVEMQLVSLEDNAVILSVRGADVAYGRANVPGVRQLQPGE